MNKIDSKLVLIGLLLVTNLLILFELKKPNPPTIQDVKIVAIKPNLDIPIVNSKDFFPLSGDNVIDVRIVR